MFWTSSTGSGSSMCGPTRTSTSLWSRPSALCGAWTLSRFAAAMHCGATLPDNSVVFRPRLTACSSINPAGASSGPIHRATERTMLLLIDPHGQVRCLYGEEIDLSALGSLAIRRASHVEPDANGGCCADLTP